jgi:hypothetical protein
MTAFAVAVQRRQWSLVSLYLLLGVSEAARKLPEDSLVALLDILAGVEREPEKETHGHC